MHGILSLLDGSDCSGPVCAQGKGTELEIGMHYDPLRLDDTSGERGELRLVCNHARTTRCGKLQIWPGDS